MIVFSSITKFGRRKQTMKTRSGSSNDFCAFKYSGRLMVRYKINGKYKYFYRSTGENSNMPKTWFPCNGIQRHKYKSKYGNRNRGWIKKPHGFEVYLYFTKKDMAFDDLTRFGTLQDMAISAVLGGGFWTEENIAKYQDYLPHVDSFHERMIKKALDMEPTLTDLSVDEVLKKI